MIGSKQLKQGMIIRLDGEIYRVLTTQHVMPGKGGAFIQTKLRNVLKGTQTDHRFRSGEPVERVIVDTYKMQFLYREADDFHFMNMENYEQTQLALDAIEGAERYLTPSLELSMEFIEGRPVGIQLPKTVTLKVLETEPYIKSATATNSFKQAKLETEANFAVPGFISEGELVEIDTESGDYVGRGKEA